MSAPRTVSSTARATCRVRLAVAAVVLLVATGTACSDDEPSARDEPTTSPSTSVGPEARPAYAGPGPYDAGELAVALADGRRVVVWYPAAKVAEGSPTQVFDIASLLSPELQQQVTAEQRPKYAVDAYPGAVPATGGPFPLVLFSHGFAGFPEQSVNLTTHLARWGFVVVAPDHVERSLDGLLGTAARNLAQKSTDMQVLSRSLDVAVAENGRPGSPVHDLVNADEVAVIGHSAGARAAYEMAAADPRIRSFIAYSVAVGQRGPAPPVPTVPGMVMAGTTDGIIPLAASGAVYRAMNAPKYLVKITGAGHLVFSDICLIGRDKGGLVGLTRQAGLDLPENLLRQAADGCQPADLDPVLAFPAIDHLSVAFLRSTLGVDEQPVGLDPSVTKAFRGVDVTLEATP